MKHVKIVIGVVVSTHDLAAFTGVFTHLTVFLDGNMSPIVDLTTDGDRAPLSELYRRQVDDLLDAKHGE